MRDIHLEVGRDGGYRTRECLDSGRRADTHTVTLTIETKTLTTTLIGTHFDGTLRSGEPFLTVALAETTETIVVTVLGTTHLRAVRTAPTRETLTATTQTDTVVFRSTLVRTNLFVSGTVGSTTRSVEEGSFTHALTCQRIACTTVTTVGARTLCTVNSSPSRLAHALDTVADTVDT